ncbi:hypothetical protein [Nocardiopsis sp. YSL2]|uniref:hypothetical protein n=1 Tax=Nocardiopsis sp. YSL2 TaxID=2939492 RepID=UPI0026F41963|nr:hypothetical protein [Nocardiopsis sp. YSL2]
MRRRRRQSPGSSLARFTSAAASAGAAQIHLVMAPDHWGEWWVSGLFFVVTGIAQTVWAVLAVWPGGPALMLAGAALNLGSVGTWALSRVWGLPFGPHAWLPEPAGTTDLVAVGLEAVVVAGALWALARRGAERDPRTAGVAWAVSAALAVALSTAVAVNGADEHAHATDAHATGAGGAEDQGEHGEEPMDGSGAQPGGAAEDPPSTSDPEGGQGHVDDGHDHEH